MLSDEQNRTLTQVGPGTLMGELLRRYWMPIAAVAELDDKPMKPVRLLGEDLVLYRDQAAAIMASWTGTARTAAPTCPTAGSRTAACAATTTAGCGIDTGKCLEQPFEETAHPEARFKDRVGSRPTRSRPRPALCGPTWGRRRHRSCRRGSLSPGRNGFVQIVFAEIPCNWFQCQENSIDPVHFEWLHGNWSRVAAE